MEDTSLPVVVFGMDGVIVEANAVATRMMGIEPDQAAGRALTEFYSPELIADRLDLIREAMQAGRPVTIEGMVKGRLMRSVCRPISTPGQPLRVLAVCRPAGGPDTAAEAGIVRARVNDSGALGALTTREIEILKLIGVGYSTAEIAQKLDRSVKTVEWHRVSLGEKLGVTNRVELARIAIAAGLVGLDEPAAGGGNGAA